MKRHLFTIARLLVAAAGIGYIVWSLTWVDHVVVPAGYRIDGSVFEEPADLKVLRADGEALVVELPGGGEARVARSQLVEHDDGPRFRPGVLTTLGGANVALLVTAVVLLAPIFPVQALRWFILMRSRGMAVGLGRTFRLTMVGVFFNFCMPGTTGGDVAKAYYAAKGSGQRGTAVMSVIFDRIAGLVGLVIMAGLVGLLLFENGLVRRITFGVWAGAAVMGVGTFLYFSSGVRRGLGVDALIGRLSPTNVFVRLDRAAVAYRHHKPAFAAAVGMSLPVHIAQTSATAIAGLALGIDLPVVLLLTVLPVVFMVGSIPISYQGLGVMEWLAVRLLVSPGLATVNQVVGMLLLFRLFMIAYALLGSTMLMRGDIHLHPEPDEGASQPPAGPDV